MVLYYRNHWILLQSEIFLPYNFIKHTTQSIYHVIIVRTWGNKTNFAACIFTSMSASVDPSRVGRGLSQYQVIRPIQFQEDRSSCNMFSLCLPHRWGNVPFPLLLSLPYLSISPCLTQWPVSECGIPDLRPCTNWPPSEGPPSEEEGGNLYRDLWRTFTVKRISLPPLANWPLIRETFWLATRFPVETRPRDQGCQVLGKFH